MPAFLEKLLLSAVCPGGRRGRLSILIFHRVIDEPDPLFPDDAESVSDFDTILSWVSQWFRVLPLQDAVEKLESGNLPRRAACITFDDGYADNYLNALPVLQKHGLHATFFIATGFLDGKRMWNDTIIEAIRLTPGEEIDASSIGLGRLRTGTLDEKREAVGSLVTELKHRPPEERAELVAGLAGSVDATLPTDLMMTTDQLLALHASGMGIGAHTVTHPILRLCDEEAARAEISDSRETLQSVLGEDIRLFAYPNGKRGDDYGDREARIVQELGFDAAVSTNPGTSRPGDSLFELRRYTPWRMKRHAFLAQLMKNALVNH